MEAKEWRKSALEVALEKQGWIYMGNVFQYDDASLIGGQPTRRTIPISDADIKAEYLKGGFKEVMVTDAYDVVASPLPSHRAVYVLK